MPSLKELENLKTILLGEKAANVLGGISKYKEILAAFRETYDKEKADGYIVISQKLFRSREQELADRTYNECYSIYKGFSDRKKEGIESVLKTSYYTPEAVVTGVKKALNTYLQNTKGSIRILEPSAGDGSFIKPFLTDKSMKTSCFAVEKCPLAFERLQKNIPPINKEGKMIMSPYNDPFEQLYFDSFTFDLVLGNFPFGDFKPALAKGQNPYKEFDNNIQNFFILKSLQHLRNGGLMVFLCSDRFADNNKNLAKEVFKKANFIGGLRLHNEIFKKENTKVVSDIVMLQKNENKTQITEIEKEFLEEYTFPSKNDPEKTLRISKYFKKQMFGELDEGFFNYQYNPTVRNAFANQEPAFTENFIADTLSMALKKAFDKKIFQENLFFKEPPKAPPKAIKKEKEATPPNHFQNFVLKNYPNIKKGNLLFWNEKLVHLKNEKENAFDYEPILEPIFAKPSKRKKIGTGQLAFFDNAGEPAQKNLQLNKEETIFYEDFIKLTQKYNEQESEKGNFDKTYFIKNHYATFFKKHGPLKNHLPKIQKDFHHKTLLNIEKNKSIFEENQTKIPLQKATLPKQPPTIEEILEDSYDKFNCVNIDFVNTIYDNAYGHTNWMKAALKNKNVFINPVYDRVGVFQKVELASKNDFLSGMLFKKINFLKTDFLKYLEKQGNITILKDFDFLNGATLRFEDFDFQRENFKTLQQHCPPKLPIKELDFNFGEAFLSTKVFENFCKAYLDNDTKIYYNAHTSVYVISGSNSLKTPNFTIENEKGDNMHWKMLFQNALNGTYKDYYYSIPLEKGKSKRVFNQEFTTLIHKKIDAINRDFKKWLLQDPQKNIAEELTNRYYLLNNAFVEKEYNVDFMTLPKMKNFIPYEHQKEAALKFITNEGGILDHKVGFGKTATMGLTNQKLKMMGKPNKTLLCCLNANYEKVYAEIREIFPEAKMLLIPSRKELTKNDALLKKIANEHWDFVVLPHTFLNAIPKDIEVQLDILKEKMAQLDAVITSENELKDKTMNAQQLARLRNKQEQYEADFHYTLQLKKQKEIQSELSFSDLGFDYIFVDESHYFKNLAIATKLDVSGLGNIAGSQKCDDFLSICRSIQNKWGDDKGILMCSGTTISNSLTELYNLLEYTRPQKLRELNIACFDQWARSYSKISREFEHKLDGSVKLFKRLRWFEKVPELSKLYNDICHYADEKTFDIGSPQVQQKAVIIKPSPAQKKHFQSIKNFLKTSNISCLPNYKNKMGDKNWKKRMETAKGLIAMTQGREASVDVRGLDIAYTEEDLNHCKAKYCADKVFEIYKKYEKHKGTQIIFSDMFTPTSKKFNIYKEIKELLVSKGIAKHQIQFIHDHNTEMKKENLLKAVNQGMVRVILGSTQKLGTGVNAQKRIVAMHNLDVPFRPSDVEQRLGRGARAGNELAKNLLQNKVPAYFYLVEESTDNYILNLVNIKNNFIKQFKQCNVLDRTFDTGDVDDDGKVNYAQLLKMTAKDSLLPDLIKVQSEIKQLEMEREAERKAHNRRKEAYENTKKTLQKVNTQKQYYENIKNKMQDENLSIQLGKNNFNIHKDTQKIGAFIQEKSKNLQEKLQKYTKTNAATFRQEGGNKTILLGKTSNEHLLILEPDLKTIQSDIKIEGKYVMKRKLELHLILKNPDEKEFTHKSGQVTKDKKDMGNYIVNAYNTTIQKHLEGYHKTKKQYEEYLKINQKYENDFAFEKENTIAEKRKQYQTLHAKLEGKKDMQEDMGMGM